MTMRRFPAAALALAAPSRPTAAIILVACATGLAPPAAGATTTDIESRILTQEGLAIALASTVLQSQLAVLEFTLSPRPCTPQTGGGSVRTLSVQKVSATVTDSKVTVYFDTACKTPYIEAVAAVTQSSSSYSIVETATYLGLQGETLGSLSLSESAAFGRASDLLIGLGKFSPADGAQTVDLGLTCTLPTSRKATTAVCEGGIAQKFPKLGLSLASVTPLTLTVQKPGSSSSVSFTGKKSDMQTGAPGSLSIITPTGSSLGIGGNGTAYGSAATKGFASKFALFPPTPTHWAITDTTHDAKFYLQVVSNTIRNSKASVTSISSGAALATINVDQSGTGAISYADGSKSTITSWLLAD